jgi:hypothetical protein
MYIFMILMAIAGNKISRNFFCQTIVLIIQIVKSKSWLLKTIFEGNLDFQKP